MFATKPFFGFGWIETTAQELYKMITQKSTKPFFGFGWIETVNLQVHRDLAEYATKPFFGFGWIETLNLYLITGFIRLLLNPSSASAGLKRLIL